MSGFDVLNPGATNTLVGWVGAQGALIVEKRSEIEIAKDCMELLSQVFKKSIPMPCKVYRYVKVFLIFGSIFILWSVI